MYEYNIKDDELMMIANKCLKASEATIEDRVKFRLVRDVANSAIKYGSISQKQTNVLARFYYGKVYEYKKPTPKMIKDARLEAAKELAKDKIRLEELFQELDEIDTSTCEEDYICH